MQFKVLGMVVLSLFLPAAYALDQSVDVKATTLLKTTQDWAGQALVYPTGQAEVSGVLIEIAPGGQTGWHLHPVPSFAMMLEGELEVRLKNGAVKRLKAGDALAETVNVLHNGHNVGAGPVKLVVFYAGVVNAPLTVKEEVK